MVMRIYINAGGLSSGPHACSFSTLIESFKRNLYKAKEGLCLQPLCKACGFSWSLGRCCLSWYATSQSTGPGSLSRVGSEIIVMGQVEGSVAGDSP